MKLSNALALATLAVMSFFVSSCEKTSDSVTPVSAVTAVADARPIAFNPENATVGTVYYHGDAATGLVGYPMAALTLTKIQGTGQRTMYMFKGTLAAGMFPAGGYVSPFTGSFNYGVLNYRCDNFATLDASGQMVLKQTIDKSFY